MRQTCPLGLRRGGPQASRPLRTSPRDLGVRFLPRGLCPVRAVHHQGPRAQHAPRAHAHLPVRLCSEGVPRFGNATRPRRARWCQEGGGSDYRAIRGARPGPSPPSEVDWSATFALRRTAQQVGHARPAVSYERYTHGPGSTRGTSPAALPSNVVAFRMPMSRGVCKACWVS